MRPAATSSLSRDQLLAAAEGEVNAPSAYVDPVELDAGEDVGSPRRRTPPRGPRSPPARSGPRIRSRGLERWSPAPRSARRPERARSRSRHRRPRPASPGSSVTCTASRLVQYGVSASPSTGGTAGRRAGVQHDATSGVVGELAAVGGLDRDLARPGQPAATPWCTVAPASDQPVDRDRVVPARSVASSSMRARPAPSGDGRRRRREVWPPGDLASASLAADHHLRRDAPVVAGTRRRPGARSTTTTSRPAFAARRWRERTRRPGPAPMTTRSTLRVHSLVMRPAWRGQASRARSQTRVALLRIDVAEDAVDELRRLVGGQISAPAPSPR